MGALGFLEKPASREQLTGALKTLASFVERPVKRLLLVEDENAEGVLSGKPRLALDVVDAGEGDRVLVVDEGNAAAQVLTRGRGPVRTVIVGIVDEVESEGPAPRAARS